MRHSQEKGIEVKPTEPVHEDSPTSSGCGDRMPLMRGSGCGPARHPRARRQSSTLIEDGTPNGTFHLEVFSTRASIPHPSQASQGTFIVQPNGSEAEWYFEYSSVSETGPWVVAATGTASTNERQGEGAYVEGMATHLSPGTSYYARVRAKNASGEVSTPILKFTTLPVSGPTFQYAPCGPLTGLGELGSVETARQMCGALHITSADIFAELETNGAETKYHFEYASSASGPFTPVPGAEGTVTVAEDLAKVEAHLTALTPETIYYLRAVAENGHNPSASLTVKFKTATNHPSASVREVRNVTATSAHIAGDVHPQGSETHWRFESATSVTGPWSPVPGGNGVISSAEADESLHEVGVELSSLAPSTTYYVRLYCESEHGTSTDQSPPSFQTAGPPSATTYAVHSIHGEFMRLLGTVNPNSIATSEEHTVTIVGVPTGGTFTLTLVWSDHQPNSVQRYGVW